MSTATNPYHNNKVEIEGSWFRDSESNRTVGFRGINLGGNSKLPIGWTTSNGADAFNIDNLSFVGKPLPLDQAEEHCLRLKYWGFNFIRLLVPWESIEHKGPGKYDNDYINYIIKLLHLFKKYNLKCLIDPHQDTWSRLCGGSGMPNWTLYLAGMDPRKFKKTISAITMFENDPPLEYPIMTWPTNYGRLATATMFTLFFGGEQFAPKCTILDEKLNKLVNIQTYLQDRFCEAYQYLFQEIKKEGLLKSVVLGIDTLNEPSEGFIETEDITKLPLISMTSTRNGPTPTVLEGFLLGEGNAVEVAKYSLGTLGFVKEGTMKVDPKGEKVWLKEGETKLPNLYFPPWQPWQKSGQCIWHLHNVWDRKTKKTDKPNYFSKDKDGKKYNFLKDFWKPFVRKITSYIRSVQYDIIMFIEPPVNSIPPKFTKEEGDPLENIVYSPHWYDGKTLVTLKFDWWTFDYLGFIRGKYWFIGQALKIGRHDVRKCFEEMIQMLKAEGELALNETPLLIGESGIPYNMSKSQAFKDGNYQEQINALDASLNATEQIGSMCTLWNYCYDNTHLEGDLWNREDLSIYSTDTKIPQEQVYADKFQLYKIPLDKGGRALEAAVRPYPLFTPGIPLSHEFVLANDNKSGVPYYTYSFKGDELNQELGNKVVNKCEIFLPCHHFPPNTKLNVQVNDGKWDISLQSLKINNGNNNFNLYDGYATDEPIYQVLVWSFEFSLLAGNTYTIKITHLDSPFPKITSNRFFFC